MTAASLGRNALLLAVLLPACGGVSHRLDRDATPPRTIAVLPFGGELPLPARDLTRGLLHGQLQSRGLQVAENAWTDRRLAEAGWLADPAALEPGALDAAAVCNELGVDAVLVGTGFAESSFNLLLLRRHSLGGEVRLLLRDGSEWWRASHSAAVTGGFLLKSGQVFTELRDLGEHGTSAQTLGLIHEFVGGVAGTLPARAPVDGAAGPGPELGEVRAFREAGPNGDRVVVEATATPGSSLRFDLADGSTGVPMSGRLGRFRGASDVAAGGAAGAVRVTARDAFGAVTSAEVVVR